MVAVQNRALDGFARTLWARSLRPQVRQLPQAFRRLTKSGSRNRISLSRLPRTLASYRDFGPDRLIEACFHPQILLKTRLSVTKHDGVQVARSAMTIDKHRPHAVLFTSIR